LGKNYKDAKAGQDEMTEKDYTEGYRDGFKDGFQAGSKSDEILVVKENNQSPNKTLKSQIKLATPTFGELECNENKSDKGFGGIIYGKYETGGDDGKSFYDGGRLGCASRFFYCAKATKTERNLGCNNIPEDKTGHGNLGNSKGFERFDTNNNNHPTVKPLALMRYLVKLITPKNGIVLDPFAGSGTTLIGAKLEGYRFIGIEMEPEYIKIARARLEAY